MENVCTMCNEYITTPIAPESVGKHIELWLPQKYTKDFTHFNTKLVKDSDGSTSNYLPDLLCIHCYVKEVHQWIKNKDKRLAKTFIRLFSFGYSEESYVTDIQTDQFEDVEQRENETGLCDECGEYSEMLVGGSGEWLCQECASMDEEFD